MKVGDRVRIIDTNGIAVRYKDRLGTIRRIYSGVGRAEVDVDDMDTPTLYLSRLELVVEPDDWQPGDRAYCEEPGHPAQGCLVEVKGPYEFDADRLTVYGLSGKTYHAAKQYLRRESSVPRQPAPPQPTTRPCPCTNTKDPGHTTGYFGDRVQCYDCRGTLVLGSVSPARSAIQRHVDVQIGSAAQNLISAVAQMLADQDALIGTLARTFNVPLPSDFKQQSAKEIGEELHRALENVISQPKKQDDTVCRTWPLAVGETLAVGDKVCIVVTTRRLADYGEVIAIDADGCPVTRVDHCRVHSRIGMTYAFGRNLTQRWNGVAPDGT